VLVGTPPDSDCVLLECPEEAIDQFFGDRTPHTMFAVRAVHSAHLRREEVRECIVHSVDTQTMLTTRLYEREIARSS
jgi:hypothetical protein